MALMAQVPAAAAEPTLWHWLAFGLFVVVLLALDLVVFHRDSREPTLREVGRLDGRLVRASPWPSTA